MSILENVNNIAELRALPEEQLPELCSEIRTFLIESLSKTGGHLASNLGTVELTVALDRVYDPYRDRIVFDVGHQCYTHKLLTGRREGFEKLRKYGGTKHAGYGLGFERMVMYLTGVSNIRDVLPFPRTVGTAEF